MNTKKIGDFGEQFAQSFFEDRGYVLIEKNFRSRYGEIDLILENEEYLLFVEVKTRKNAKFAQAYEAVDRRKMEKIRQTAEIWLSEQEREKQPRFDVLEVYVSLEGEKSVPKIIHWEDAFS